ncbi:hypothetical protein [Catellatospora sichuanensis]|uniref:hypothetical protein n=1 Tax=Catellatospora sichuanensis TaxID=1969805 RepID=UPI0011827FFC|nr:hypothetical protein [Catellatospora sichuanensis]
MTRLTVSVPDALAEQIKLAAGDNVSAWMAEAARDKMLSEECKALAAWEKTNRDDGWNAERWGE